MTTQLRRLRQATLVSLNGVIGAPATWAGPYFGPASAAHALAALEECDAFLMGRGTYDVFARQWPAAAGPYADRLNAMPKYVFSSTLEHTEWSRTTIVRGDPVAEVAALKARPGRDLTFYGHGRFGQALHGADLVDEWTVTIFPVVVPDGTALFRPGAPPRSWALTDVRPGADPDLAELTYRRDAS